MNPLDVSIERLRARTSMKWRQYPADVLPLWVAEMDVELAEPVVAAVTDAVYAGDTGYPLGVAEYAQALARFAEDRWGWSGIAVDRSAIVADVMVGVTEVLRLITSPGDAVVVLPGLPAVLRVRRVRRSASRRGPAIGSASCRPVQQPPLTRRSFVAVITRLRRACLP